MKEAIHYLEEARARMWGKGSFLHMQKRQRRSRSLWGEGVTQESLLACAKCSRVDLGNG